MPPSQSRLLFLDNSQFIIIRSSGLIITINNDREFTVNSWWVLDRNKKTSAVNSSLIRDAFLPIPNFLSSDGRKKGSRKAHLVVTTEYEVRPNGCWRRRHRVQTVIWCHYHDLSVQFFLYCVCCFRIPDFVHIFLCENANAPNFMCQFLSTTVIGYSDFILYANCDNSWRIEFAVANTNNKQQCKENAQCFIPFLLFVNLYFFFFFFSTQIHTKINSRL